MKKITYQDIHQVARKTADDIKDTNVKFDVVIGLARGGTIPAALIARRLNVPLVLAYYSSSEGKGTSKHANALPFNESWKNVLVVDDIWDSGNTMLSTLNFYASQDCYVQSAVVCFRHSDVSIAKPNHIGFIINSNDWIDFEFEDLDI